MKRTLAGLIALLLLAGGVRADITSNLVAHWKLDETSGTSAADSSGSGYTGTYVNTPTLNETGAFGSSKAVLFTRASTEYVLLGSKSATTPITVALWLKRTDTAAVHRLVHWGRTLLQVNAAGTGVTWYPDTGGGSTTFTVSALGTGWNHLVVTQTGTDATLYINGGSIATNATVAISTAAVTSYLAILTGSTDALNGTLDDVRIYSRALSADDVAELYAYTGTQFPYWYFQSGANRRNPFDVLAVRQPLAILKTR